MKWGLTFSTKYCQELSLDPIETFKSILNEFNFSSIRIPVYWDIVEKVQEKYDLKELLFLINSAKFKNLEVTLAVGRKVPRWPEYHDPEWAKDLSEKELYKSLFEYLDYLLNFLKNYSDFDFIQVENEPLFNFGNSKVKLTKEWLQKEISFVKSIVDKPVILTESGEGRDWFETSELADRVGVNMYKITYDGNRKKYSKYNYAPDFYKKKKERIVKNIFVAELQAEPWGPSVVQDMNFEETELSMNPTQLLENIELAKNSGFDEVWMWGVEWWYFLANQGHAEILQAAKNEINS